MEVKKYRVPKSAITERGLKKLIKDAAKDHPSLAEWARANNITPQAISAFFAKRQGPGIKIPEVIGYRPQIVYLPLDEPLIQELPAPRHETSRPSKKVDHSKPPIVKSGKARSERERVKEELQKRRKA